MHRTNWIEYLLVKLQIATPKPLSTVYVRFKKQPSNLNDDPMVQTEWRTVLNRNNRVTAETVGGKDSRPAFRLNDISYKMLTTSRPVN